MVGFKIVGHALGRINDYLKEVLLRRSPARNARVLDEIGRELVSISNFCFKHECSPAGVRWKPLSPATLKARARKGRHAGGGKILDVSGKLKRSVDYYIRDNSVIVGTKLNYAMPHQIGGRRSGRPPRREFLGVRPHSGVTFAKIVTKYGSLSFKGFSGK